jgi:hypothetical protein
MQVLLKLLGRVRLTRLVITFTAHNSIVSSGKQKLGLSGLNIQFIISVSLQSSGKLRGSANKLPVFGMKENVLNAISILFTYCGGRTDDFTIGYGYFKVQEQFGCTKITRKVIQL